MIYLAIGRRERGKTTWTYHHAHELPTRVIVDPRRQIEPRADVLVAMTSDEVEQAFDRVLQHNPAHGSPPREILIVPGDNPQAVFDTLCADERRWIELDDTRKLAVVIDEARFVDQNTPACSWILRCSPRGAVHIFFSAHRPSDLSTNVRAIADYWIMFHMTQEHDLKVVSEHCGSDVAERVRALRQFHYIEWNDGASTMMLHDKPARWKIALRSRRSMTDVSQDSVIDEGRVVGQVNLFRREG